MSYYFITAIDTGQHLPELPFRTKGQTLPLLGRLACWASALSCLPWPRITSAVKNCLPNSGYFPGSDSIQCWSTGRDKGPSHLTRTWGSKGQFWGSSWGWFFCNFCSIQLSSFLLKCWSWEVSSVKFQKLICLSWLPVGSSKLQWFLEGR